MSPSAGWRSSISPAPSWEAKVWLPALGVPTLSHPKILGISDSHSHPGGLSSAGTGDGDATEAPHLSHVPKGWGQGSGEGHGVPGQAECLRQPLAGGGRGCTAGIFLAFSLTESFQISLPLTSKRNESAAKRAWDFFFSLFPFRA